MLRAGGGAEALKDTRDMIEPRGVRSPYPALLGPDFFQARVPKTQPSALLFTPGVS